MEGVIDEPKDAVHKGPSGGEDHPRELPVEDGKGNAPPSTPDRPEAGSPRERVAENDDVEHSPDLRPAPITCWACKRPLNQHRVWFEGCPPYRETSK